MELRLYGIHKQLQFIASDVRYQCAIWGRRVGKSLSFVMKATRKSLQRKNNRYLYLGPSNALCKEMFKETINHQALKPLIRKVYRKEPYRVELNNNSAIDFRNWANIDLLRGFKFNDVFIDEIQNFPEQHFFSVVDALTKDLRGGITVAGQHNGFGWYYNHFFRRGLSPVALDAGGRPRLDKDGKPVPNTDYASWTIPTNEGLMFQGASGAKEWQSILETVPPAVLDVEYLCIPSASLNAVFPYSELELITLKAKGYKAAPDPKYSYILCLDIGRTIDPTVALVLECETGEIVYAETFAKGMPYPQQAHRAGVLHKHWGECTTVMDSTGLAGVAGGRDKHDPIVPLFRQTIKDLREFKWNYSNKLHLITHLGIEIRNKTVLIPECAKEVLRQLGQYEYRYRKSGFLTFSAPQGDHDDYVSDLALLLWARHMGWYSRKSQNGYQFKGV